MPDIYQLLRPGAVFTGEDLRAAIVQAGRPPAAGRGMRVSSWGPGQHAIHTTARRIVTPKIVRFPALITGSAEIEPNRWRYEWAEAEMSPIAPSPPGDFNWFILAGGRSSVDLGEAFNRYELRHTDLVALGGVTLASLPADLVVLPIPVDDLVELTEYTSTEDESSVTFKAVWFDRPNGVEVTCPDPPPGAAGLTILPIAEVVL